MGFSDPATALIAWMSFYPMIQAFILSLQTGLGINLKFGGLTNYTRILQDATFRQCLFNTIFYLIIQVPVMLILALILASMLEQQTFEIQGTVPYDDLSAVRNILGILFHDFPFHVRQRWPGQHTSPWNRYGTRDVVCQCVDSTCGYHHRADLALDRI